MDTNPQRKDASSGLRDYFATTGKGLESILEKELQALGFADIEQTPGGVSFRGDLADGYRANLWLRTASRILMPLARFQCEDERSLYHGVRRIPWQEHLTPDMTLAVDCNLRNSRLTHARFAALKTKDAVVDLLRDRCGRRPNVDPRNPDLRINVHLIRNRCTVSLDMSGRGLHQRGYGRDRTEAPLRETLAAALVDLAGWDGSVPLVDPMCGSGTIVIEAACKASRRAPGLAGPGFGFERWRDFRPQAWRSLLEEARETARDVIGQPLLGTDRSPKAIAAARRNAGRAGVAELISLAPGDIRDLSLPPEPGVLLFNPPYGARLGDVEALKPLYRQIGDALKQQGTGWTAYLLAGNPELAKFVGLKASRRIVLFNGPIECRLLQYDLY